MPRYQGLVILGTRATFNLPQYLRRAKSANPKGLRTQAVSSKGKGGDSFNGANICVMETP